MSKGSSGVAVATRARVLARSRTTPPSRPWTMAARTSLPGEARNRSMSGRRLRSTAYPATRSFRASQAARSAWMRRAASEATFSWVFWRAAIPA